MAVVNIDAIGTPRLRNLGNCGVVLIRTLALVKDATKAWREVEKNSRNGF
jgi:hypothetical protein